MNLTQVLCEWWLSTARGDEHTRQRSLCARFSLQWGRLCAGSGRGCHGGGWGWGVGVRPPLPSPHRQRRTYAEAGACAPTGEQCLSSQTNLFQMCLCNLCLNDTAKPPCMESQTHLYLNCMPASVCTSALPGRRSKWFSVLLCHVAVYKRAVQNVDRAEGANCGCCILHRV